MITDLITVIYYGALFEKKLFTIVHVICGLFVAFFVRYILDISTYFTVVFCHIESHIEKRFFIRWIYPIYTSHSATNYFPNASHTLCVTIKERLRLFASAN